jgi:hypothetical protein
MTHAWREAGNMQGIILSSLEKEKERGEVVDRADLEFSSELTF